MVKAVRIHEHGGPEVLKYEDVQVGAPGSGEALIRQTAIGLNFIDIYYRTGLYPAPDGLPLITGGEGAGIVESVGEGVTNVKVGDRIAYASGLGAYAEKRLMPADRLVHIPDGVSDEQAAAMMLKGMTVEYLVQRTYPIKKGDTVLYHAAAGGVGLMFGQWAKSIGARVIGTASSDEKIALAKAHGFDEVINYRQTDFAAAVKELTDGKLCDVVYDSVGKDTFAGSLDCLRPRGMFVSFGNASGPVPPFEMGLLSRKGSLYATRPTLFAYIATRADLELSARTLFEKVTSGAVKVEVETRHALKDVGAAQAALEGRKTTGASILIP
ncbi:MAG: quinone oxidoreductase [Mesorhizobium sp.]